MHFLLWLEAGLLSNSVDDVISAEIPDIDEDPLLHELVVSHMIHGPCGKHSKSPCMEKSKGACSKRFPKKIVRDTQTGDDGYPLYRRRSPSDGGHTHKLSSGATVDNSWVVPYNPVLLRLFCSHCNVEYCHSVKAIKYICKYVLKGSDMAAFSLDNLRDEPSFYENGRYICSSEA